MSAEKRIVELGLELPPPARPAGNYVPFKRTGNLLLLSGVGPHKPDGTFIAGIVGGDLSVEEGYNAARQCGLVLLAHMRAALGSLDQVASVVKVLSFPFLRL